jgi:leucyl/phenylalanyl-tRNA---protein transferase
MKGIFSRQILDNRLVRAHPFGKQKLLLSPDMERWQYISQRSEPQDPGPSVWAFPSPRLLRGDLVCEGADLEPATILSGYRSGVFPMPIDDRLAWWSPNPRGILPLDGLHVSRSLQKSCGRFEIRTDTAFRSVMERCADPRRPHGWITQPFLDAYGRLHDMGWAHSVEAWQDNRLVGGLYGLAIGGLFAGESMFHEVTDASKVVLVALVSGLQNGGFSLLDVQWKTDHLARLGVQEISRKRYLEQLVQAREQPAVWKLITCSSVT